MKSLVTKTNDMELPLIDGKFPMIPFDLNTLDGLSDEFSGIAKGMLKNVKHKGGTAFLTVHGKQLVKGDTLRRPAPHIDGNYNLPEMDFNGGGGKWKTLEAVRHPGGPIHNRQFVKDTGGILMCSNYQSCIGWVGEFDDLPRMGGDCSHIELNTPFNLNPNQVYYGNNHFIHESLPVEEDVHRVLARITLPEDHVYTIN